MDKYLHRNEAPFDEKVWAAIDEAVNEAARSQLSARRMLDIDGPYGLGLKSVAGRDYTPEKNKESGSVEISTSQSIPVTAMQKTFSLAVRDVAHFEQTGMPMEMKDAALAAIACAAMEDSLIFYGSRALSIEGLLNAKGTLSLKLQKWDEAGKAADDLIKAVTSLDNAGFHGPYILALAPVLYNLLFRRYPQGDHIELEHLKSIAGSIIKAPSINSGGVLLAKGKQFASVVIGQDLITRFEGPSAGHYEFTIFESLALRLLEPSALCVLQ